jgi:hypothetical protein
VAHELLKPQGAWFAAAGTAAGKQQPAQKNMNMPAAGHIALRYNFLVISRALSYITQTQMSLTHIEAIDSHGCLDITN